MLLLGLFVLTIASTGVPSVSQDLSEPLLYSRFPISDSDDPDDIDTGNTCGENEIFVECIPQCNVDPCEFHPCDPENVPCRSGCMCTAGYIRESGACVPFTGCGDRLRLVSEGPESTLSRIDVNNQGATTPGPVAVEPKRCLPRCKPTCAVPNPPNCSPNPACESCGEGYVYPNRRNNTCIPIYQCPTGRGCNGDRNAVIAQRVIACPPTCRKPSQSNCNKPNLPTGCICKRGYIKSRVNGKCIPLERCPGSNPCGRNQTFTTCTYCIFDQCPTGSLIRYPCDPLFPCPAGCICASGYRRLNGQCILASDCPPPVGNDLPVDI